MKLSRDRVDAGFESLARVIYRNRIKTLIIVLLVSLGLISQITRFKADFTDDAFFHPGDPILEEFNAFRDQFGREESIVVLINPKDVFNTHFLKKLADLHHALEEEIPFLDDITSLVNVRYTYGKEDELVVEDLLEVIPENDEAVADLKTRVMKSRLYQNLLISPDGKSTVILLKLLAYTQKGIESESDTQADVENAPTKEQPIELTNAEMAEAVAAVRKVIKRYEGSDFPILLTGGPVVGVFFETNIMKEQGLFMGLSMAAFLILLFLLFRRVSGIVLPLLVIYLGLGATFSLMGIFGATFSHPTSIIPVFLLSVGIGDSVHLLALFYRHYRESQDKEASIVFAMKHSGLPILMTSLTTAAGLISFAAADMLPVANLGLFGGIGVLLALIYTVTLIPALIALLPIKSNTLAAGKNYGAGFDRLLTAIANFSARRAWTVICISIFLIGVSAVGIFEQRFTHNTNEWLPHQSELRDSLDLLDQQFGGSSSLEVIVDTGRQNGLYSPSTLNSIEEIEQYAEAYRKKDGAPIVGKTESILNVLKETHQSLHQNQTEFYAIPQNRQLIAQELLLFENSGSDDLEPLVDSQFSKARLSLKTSNEDAKTYFRFVESIAQRAKEIFLESIKVTLTGSTRNFAHIMHMIMVDMARSYIIAGVVITILMIVFLSSFRMGLLSLIPNISPLIITIGIMGWLDIPLDMQNMLIGTIAIGLAVDDTIHLLHNYRRYYQVSGDTADAVRQSLHTSGRAMLFTTLILVTGFLLYTLSEFPPMFTFGLAIGSTLITALLADIFLVPAILEVINRRKTAGKIS